ncbi:DNA-formamidopyrimidine glycosylase family protein [Litorihabitans aurantiacus]|uniref:Formamidopyrimidine-DNA glycosylase n=1 Tax=Litorihabitans aurantiacus TaxID=1930061 RepID=A0AA38CRR5_9MICO|nr:DNA-formamidopyrimidine glycosylase family protein [Litorihabitans aurantiacus]GMA32096.1 formamidopyrimidine-DNA glycosylase [Litorihabitans aurantiacus]
MPELPEVDALGSYLRERTASRIVVAAHVAQIGALKTFSPPLDDTVGRGVAGVERFGKWLAIGLGPRGEVDPDAAEIHLVLHLAKAGWLRWREEMPPATSPKGRPMGRAAGPVALRLWFDDGSGFDLTEAGTRKRLAVHVVADPAEIPAVASLGFDPVREMSADALGTALRSRNQQVKGALRDQNLVAGIGNAYSDEILHAARMSPFTLTRSLGDDDVARLAAAVTEVLDAAVAQAAGRPAADLKDAKRRGMAVHGRAGQPCPVCGDVVREVSFADRSLQYCATCQTGGTPLADRRMSRLLR